MGQHVRPRPLGPQSLAQEFWPLDDLASRGRMASKCNKIREASEAFKHAQERRCEGWLTDKNLCDAVAVVGLEGYRVPFLRAPLASLSMPLKAALYGEFQEGQTHELTLKDVAVDAFDVMIRTAYNLEPKLTPVRALRAFVAAKLYIIDDLEAYCLHYLESSEDVDGPAALQILNESLQLSMDLPENIQCKCWSTVLTESLKIVQSPFFLETHGSIIAILIKLDEFYVCEETLWERLVDWSAAAVQKPDLLGPFDTTPPEDGVDRKVAILRLISPHIRFTQMSKDFFVDRVRKYLNREESDAITDYFLLGRQADGLLINQRVGLDPKIEPMTWNWHEIPIPWGGDLPENPRKVTFEKAAWVTKVELIFGSWDDVDEPPTWYVSAAGHTFQERTCELENDKIKSVIDISLQDPCDELIIELSGMVGNDPPETVRVHDYDFIEVRRAQLEMATELAKRLSTDFCLTPSSATDWRRLQ